MEETKEEKKEMEEKSIYTVSRVELTDEKKVRVRAVLREIQDAQEKYEKEVKILETKIKDLYYTSSVLENLSERVYEKMNDEIDSVLIQINNNLKLSSIDTKEYDIQKVRYYDVYAFLRERKFTQQDADFLCSLTQKVYDLAIAKHKFTDADEKLVLTRRDKINIIVNEDMLRNKEIIINELKKYSDVMDVYNKFLKEVSAKITDVSNDIQELRSDVEKLNKNRDVKRAELLEKIDEILGECVEYDGREFDVMYMTYDELREHFDAQTVKFLLDELHSYYEVVELQNRFDNSKFLCIRKRRNKKVFVLS